MKTLSKIVIVGICLVIGVIGLRFKTGNQVLLLDHYPQIDGYSIAIKYKSISIWQFPVIKMNSEYIAVRGYVAENGFVTSASEAIVLDNYTKSNIEAQYGSFNRNIPGKYKYGWLAAIGGLFMFIVAFIVIDGTIGAEIDVEIN